MVNIYINNINQAWYFDISLVEATSIAYNMFILPCEKHCKRQVALKGL